MSFEDLLQEVGGFGKYQVLVVLMLCLPRLVIPMHFLLHNFISASPPHHCAIPDFAGISNISQEEIFRTVLPRDPDGGLSPCKVFSSPWSHSLVNSSWELHDASSTQSCWQGWVYDATQYVSTTATEVSAAGASASPGCLLELGRQREEGCRLDEWEACRSIGTVRTILALFFRRRRLWDLVCEKKALNQAIATFFFIGVTFGAVLFGYLSDRFGRRKTLVLSLCITLFFGTMSAFSMSYPMFVVMRSLCGMGLTGLSIISMILAVEWTDIKHRTFCGTVSSLSWSVGYMLLALVAYLIRSWRWLVLAVTSPCLLGIAVCWWLPESARWLLMRKEVKAAQSSLCRCARVNGRGDICSRITPEVSAKRKGG
ncbi:Solute carrier family 22 member 7 [Varanus komodoensis]|nr:Solute carrier family 22 member 7 [Varanus komodoensis]